MALTPPAQLEALLFAAGEAMPKKRIASVIGVPVDLLGKAIEALRADLENRGLALVETETDLELRTSAEASELVRKLRENELSRDLGKAGLETLAIVLYRGSATRSEVDWVRGVNSSQTLRSLLLRGLIEKTEDQEDKRRPRYKPTVDALAHLGVLTKEELTGFAELNDLFNKREVQAAEVDEV